MSVVKTSSKGQIVIPVEIRRKLGIKPGQRVTLTLIDGSRDLGRPMIFVGETQLMSQVGPLPVQARIEVATLKEAIQALPGYSALQSTVNTQGDWTTAAGNDANDGLSPATPKIVSMHDANEVATRSVGENFSPLPWLSTGASVSIFEHEAKCSQTVLNSPTY